MMSESVIPFLTRTDNHKPQSVARNESTNMLVTALLLIVER